MKKKSQNNSAPEDEQKKQPRVQLAKQIIQQKQKKQYAKYSYQIVFGIFISLCLVSLFSSLFTKKQRKPNEILVNDFEEIEVVNNKGYPYQLGHMKFFENWTLQDAGVIITSKLRGQDEDISNCSSYQDSSAVPPSYNFYTEYSQCKYPVYNQRNCSSSYAIASVSSLSDRLCKHNQRHSKVRLSPQSLIACEKGENFGCYGGTVSKSLYQAKNTGIVNEDCLAYDGINFETCGDIFRCKRYKISQYCKAELSQTLLIKREIFSNGPVIAVLNVYRDFLNYKDGIYYAVRQQYKYQQGHTVKIVGWQLDERLGLEYWIVQNSWGNQWGVDGFVYIGIDQDNMFSDQYVLAATPITNQFVQQQI